MPTQTIWGCLAYGSLGVTLSDVHTRSLRFRITAPQFPVHTDPYSVMTQW